VIALEGTRVFVIGDPAAEDLVRAVLRLRQDGAAVFAAGDSAVIDGVSELAGYARDVDMMLDAEVVVYVPSAYLEPNARSLLETASAAQLGTLVSFAELSAPAA